ncbi:hypothetical protein LZK82_03015 [Rhizobium leguminosarum]|nr:hypothetical protein LZK82_03015 [Rhizobium leguminosarum]UIK11430.1 hypothetical protein LZK80_03005 [Rhizobium leguminosarum]
MTDTVSESETVSWTNLPITEVNDRPERYYEVLDEEAAGGSLSDGPTVMNQLAAIKRSLFSLENNYRSSLAKQLALAADIAIGLKKNFFLWSDFIAADWNGVPKPPSADQSDALRHVLRWLCGPTRAGKQRSSFYFRAVSPLVEKGLTGSKLEKKLSKKGVKVLAAQHAAESRSERSEAVVDSPFAPTEKRGSWRVRLDVEFDRKPDALFGLDGDPVFTFRGVVKDLDAKRARMSVLGYSFNLDD